jgi:hypothetical protein
MRVAPIIILLLAAGCVNQYQPLNELRDPLPQGQWAWCMAPDGEIIGWTSSATRQGETPYGTCALPARFVLVPVCREGQIPPDESPASRAARVRLSDDSTLHGDSFDGRPFCAPVPPS